MIAIITETPSVAEAIARVVGAERKERGYYEGNDYLVTWTSGHLVTLAPPQSYGGQKLTAGKLPLPAPFKLIIRQRLTDKGSTTDPAAARQLQVIDEVFSRSRSIIAATDAGEEGELAFRRIYAYLGYTKPFERLWLSSLTDEAIRYGMAHLRDGHDFDALYEEADCRAKADWLVDINANHALAEASGLGNNALGRVQTPTLAMICARYREHKRFVSAAYWTLTLTLRKEAGLRQFRLLQTIGNRKDAEELYERLGKCSAATIVKAECRKRYQLPPLLYDLSALQKASSLHLDLTAAETLAAAQGLYEKRLISYPRTESRYISEDIMTTMPEVLEALFHQEAFADLRRHLEKKRLTRRSVDGAKVTGHHAIIATGVPPEALSEPQRQVYRMIVLRMLEAFAPRCEKQRSLVEASAAGLRFRSCTQRILRAGWRDVCGRDEDREEEEMAALPVEFSTGEVIPIDGFSLGKGHTVPLPLYTEATLLTAMESAGHQNADTTKCTAAQSVGLGTPARRAAVIETLFERGYAERSAKTIIPTERGLYLYDAVRGLQIADVILTEAWEKALRQIARREMAAESFMNAMAVYARQAAEEIASIRFSPTLSAFICPRCHTGRIILRRRLVKCSNEQCELVLFRTQFDKDLTDKQIEQLLTSGKTDVIEGFRDKSGRTFDAVLTLDEEYRVKFLAALKDS